MLLSSRLAHQLLNQKNLLVIVSYSKPNHSTLFRLNLYTTYSITLTKINLDLLSLFISNIKYNFLLSLLTDEIYCSKIFLRFGLYEHLMKCSQFHSTLH